MNELSDLPKPREISELINETELEVDRRLLAEQQELEFKQDLETKLEGNEGSKNKPQKAAKIKVPDDVQAENRKSGKQNGTASQTTVPVEDKKINEEGESSSESKLTTDEAAAQTAAGQQSGTAILENGPEIPAINEADHLAGSVPENRDQHSDRSAESPGISSEKAPAAPEENGQDHSGTSVPENLDHHSDRSAANLEQDSTSSRSSDQVPTARKESEQENPATEEQDRLTTGVLQNLETASESPAADPENQEVRPEESVQTILTADAADHSGHSNENEHLGQQQQAGIHRVAFKDRDETAALRVPGTPADGCMNFG